MTQTQARTVSVPAEPGSPPAATAARPGLADRRRTLAGRAVVASLAVMSLAAAFLGSAHGGWWPALVLLGLTVTITVFFVIGALLGLSRTLIAVIVTIAVLTAGYLFAAGAPRVGPDSDVDRPAWRVIFDSVASLLSTPQGTAPRLDLLAPAFLLVGVVHTLVIYRALGRGAKRPPGFAPLVGAAMLYLAAQVVSAGTVDQSGIIAAGLVVLTLLSWTRPNVPAIGAIAGCAVAALSVAFTSLGPGWDAREVVTPPRVVVDQQNLVPYLPMWAVQQDTAMFTVTGMVPDRIAVAVYTHYTGAYWASGNDFALFGSPRIAELPAADLTSAYRMAVAPGALPGNLLPAAGSVSSVSLPDTVQDLLGGSISRIGQHRDPQPYVVSGTVDLVDDGALRAAGVPDADAAAPYLEIPELPAELQEWVDQLAGSIPGRFDQAAALESVLRKGHTVDPKGTGSSSSSGITELLGIGTATKTAAPVQDFVSAFAVLGRSLGLPTRVVVGARTSTTPGVTERTLTVRARDMTMWPEVYLVGAGWVPFDPVPGPGKTAAELKLEKLTTDENNSVESDTDEIQADSLPPAADGAGGGSGRTIALTGLTLGLLALLLVLVVLGRGAIQRRRWRAGGAAGAWTAVERAARLASLKLAPQWTTERIAGEITGRVGHQLDGLTGLAAAANQHAFGPDPLTPDREHWQVARRARNALRQSTPWWQWWRWILAPSAWRSR